MAAPSVTRREPGQGPGAYILYVEGEKQPHYVGRADTKLKPRIDQHFRYGCPVCGTPIDYCGYWDLDSAEEAYLQECQLFHKYKPASEGGSLCNQNHPACPGLGSAPCPVCWKCYR